MLVTNKKKLRGEKRKPERLETSIIFTYCEIFLPTFIKIMLRKLLENQFQQMTLFISSMKLRFILWRIVVHLTKLNIRD